MGISLIVIISMPMQCLKRRILKFCLVLVVMGPHYSKLCTDLVAREGMTWPILKATVTACTCVSESGGIRD